MGFIDNVQKDQQQYEKQRADEVYEESRKYLRKKNGLTHAICFYLFSEDVFRNMTRCEGRITDQLNQILLAMQKDEYEILDVKMVPTFEHDMLTKNRNGYLATITYK